MGRPLAVHSIGGIVVLLLYGAQHLHHLNGGFRDIRDTERLDARLFFCNSIAIAGNDFPRGSVRTRMNPPFAGSLEGVCGKIRMVKILSRLFQLAAMFLLLFMAVEVLACDLLQSDECYISAKVPSQDRNHNKPQPSGDTCLCCCTHMVTATVFTFHPGSVVTPAPPVENTQRPLFSPSSIEHPPQLS